MTRFHAYEWEKDVGYAQSVRVGNRIIVSGTVGDASKYSDTLGQLQDAYGAIIRTLAHDGASLHNVIKETIYCRKMDDLIAAQEARKVIYGNHLPAATWVQIERLYSAEHLIEIELEAVLE